MEDDLSYMRLPYGKESQIEEIRRWKGFALRAILTWKRVSVVRDCHLKNSLRRKRFAWEKRDIHPTAFVIRVSVQIPWPLHAPHPPHSIPLSDNQPCGGLPHLSIMNGEPFNEPVLALFVVLSGSDVDSLTQ
jgi:hypothetical protein